MKYKDDGKKNLHIFHFNLSENRGYSDIKIEIDCNHMMFHSRQIGKEDVIQ